MPSQMSIQLGQCHMPYTIPYHANYWRVWHGSYTHMV